MSLSLVEESEEMDLRGCHQAFEYLLIKFFPEILQWVYCMAAEAGNRRKK